LTLLESSDKTNPEMRTDSVARQMHQKTVQHYWVNRVKQQVTGVGCPTLRDTLIQPMEAALNQTTFLAQAQAMLGRAIGEHTTQQHAEVKSIINKDRQVAPKRMPLGARLAVNTHNMGGCFVESVKNVWWSMDPQEARDGLESIVEFQVQITGHNQREYGANGKDDEIGLMKSLRQNRRRMTSNRSCYYQPGGGLTRCRNLKVKGGGRGHTREGGVGSVKM